MNEAIPNKSRIMIFTIMMISSVIGSLLQTSLTTALPTIMNDLTISATTAQWLTSAYSLAMGIMVPVTPFLLKRFKTKSLLLCSMAMYLVGLLLCATAPIFSVLLLGRIIHAFGNGILLAMTQVVILTIFPMERRGTAMGIYGLAVGVAPVLAPTITGVVVDYFDWHVIFWFPLIIVALNFIFALFAMKNVLENDTPPFDFLSLVFSSVGFSGLLLGIGNLGTAPFFSVWIGLPMFVGMMMLILFCIRQIYMPVPFLDLRTFQNREFRLSVIMSMLLYAVMIAGSTLIPIYIQTVHQLSATVSGLIMMPGSIAMAIISPFAGKIYDKFGIRSLGVIGSCFLAISCFAISFVKEDTALIYLIVAYIIRLIAISFMMMPLVTWGMSTLDKKYTAHGTALLTTLRTISGAISSAVFVAILAFVTRSTSNSSIMIANSAGIDAAFVSITAVAVIQVVIAIFFIGKSNVQSKVYSE